MNMKSFHYISFISLIFLLIAAAPASAYYLSLEAPAEVRVGESFAVNGTTNLPPPDQIDIVFSHSINIPVEITRESIAITEKGDTSFNATFDTKGLDKGNYKIEALSQSQRDFSAGSRSLRVIKLIDRSDLVTINSPAYQEFEGTLQIDAKISDYDDNAILMEVKKGDEIIFGPESVPVDKKILSQEIPITSGGTYFISFTDYSGYIGTYQIHVNEEEKTTPQPTITPAKPVANQTPAETKTQITSEPTKKAVSGSEIESPVTLKTEVSRDSPAYVLVSGVKSPLTIRTSDNEDWVMEYKTSRDGAEVKVNEELGEAVEEVQIDEDVSEVFIKIYPYSYKASAEAELTAGPASSIELSDAAAAAFNAPPRYGSEQASTPLSIFAILAGLICALYVLRK